VIGICSNSELKHSLHEGTTAYNFRPVKLVLAIFLSVSFLCLEGCGEIPETGDVQEQQLNRSYAAPGQPIKPLEEPAAESHQAVPGE
jgi:hypothetical protein